MESHGDFMKEMINNSNLDDDLKYNPGFGKALSKELFRGDSYDNFVKIARESRFLPPWIKLQKEVRAALEKVIKRMEITNDEAKVDIEIDLINVKVRKFNRNCPPPMQRGLIQKDIIKQQYKRWV